MEYLWGRGGLMAHRVCGQACAEGAHMCLYWHQACSSRSIHDMYVWPLRPFLSLTTGTMWQEMDGRISTHSCHPTHLIVM